MKYEQFKQLMTDLLRIKEDERELCEAFRKFEPDFNYISFSRYEDLVVKTLKLALNDKAEWVEYFLYERDGKFSKEKIITLPDKEKMAINSYKDLWYLLTNIK
jgi:hypothetical protein